MTSVYILRTVSILRTLLVEHITSVVVAVLTLLIVLFKLLQLINMADQPIPIWGKYCCINGYEHALLNKDYQFCDTCGRRNPEPLGTVARAILVVPDAVRVA